MYSSAVAAGSVELESETDLDAVIELLKQGVPGGDSFATTIFQVPNMTSEDVAKAKKHLKLKTGDEQGLAYVESKR